MDKYSLKIKNITDKLLIKNIQINKTKFINKLYTENILKCGSNDCAISPLYKNGILVEPNKGYLVNYLQLLNVINNIQSLRLKLIILFLLYLQV